MKIAATTLIAGSIIAGGIVTNLPVANPNYADTGTSLVTYAAGNKVEVLKNQPKVILNKWNGQEQLGITVGNTNTPSTAKGTTAEIDNAIGNGQTVKMEPTSDGQGFNVDIQLASKPASNVFTYQFTGWDDMDFVYQPPLTATEVAEGAQRPDNVVGSYAVYSRVHKNHVTGQTNYETGKLFHIYRPQATDAKGNTVWASLDYANGTLSITVPQTFLDSAVYPITVDPTFGYTSIGASTNGISADSAYGSSKTTNVTSAGSVSQVSQYMSTTNPEHVMAFISTKYKQRTIITNGITNELSLGTTSAGWQTYSFATNPNVLIDNYWIEFIPHNAFDMVRYYDAGSGADTTSEVDSSNSELTPTAPGDGSNDVPNGKYYSLYATYSACSGICAVSSAIATSSASSTTNIFIAAPTSGDALVAACGSTDSVSRTINSITQTNVTWTVYPSSVKNSLGTDSEIWYALNVPSNAGTGVIINWSSAPTNASCNVTEFSGVATSAATDGNAVGTTNSINASYSNGSFTTTNANDVIFTTESQSDGFVASESVATGFTALPFATSSSSTTVSFYKVVSSTESDNPTFTKNGNAVSKAASSIGALKAAAAAGSSSSPPPLLLFDIIPFKLPDA